MSRRDVANLGEQATADVFGHVWYDTADAEDRADGIERGECERCGVERTSTTSPWASWRYFIKDGEIEEPGCVPPFADSGVP